MSLKLQQYPPSFSCSGPEQYSVQSTGSFENTQNIPSLSSLLIAICTNPRNAFEGTAACEYPFGFRRTEYIHVCEILDTNRTRTIVSESHVSAQIRNCLRVAVKGGRTHKSPSMNPAVSLLTNSVPPRRQTFHPIPPATPADPFQYLSIFLWRSSKVFAAEEVNSPIIPNRPERVANKRSGRRVSAADVGGARDPTCENRLISEIA